LASQAIAKHLILKVESHSSVMMKTTKNLFVTMILIGLLVQCKEDNEIAEEEIEIVLTPYTCSILEDERTEYYYGNETIQAVSESKKEWKFYPNERSPEKIIYEMTTKTCNALSQNCSTKEDRREFNISLSNTAIIIIPDDSSFVLEIVNGEFQSITNYRRDSLDSNNLKPTQIAKFTYQNYNLVRTSYYNIKEDSVRVPGGYIEYSYTNNDAKSWKYFSPIKGGFQHVSTINYLFDSSKNPLKGNLLTLVLTLTSPHELTSFISEHALTGYSLTYHLSDPSTLVTSEIARYDQNGRVNSLAYYFSSEYARVKRVRSYVSCSE
jgi:hypothetical protein